MNVERITAELAQAAAWLCVQAGETVETVQKVTFLNRGELIAIEVNGRVVGEVDKVLLAAEPPVAPA